MKKKAMTKKTSRVSKGRELAIKKATVPADVAKMYAEDAQDNLSNVRDAFYKVSIQGGRFKVDEHLIGDQGISFNAIILRETPVNVWYETVYDPANPVPPECWSLGGLVPDPSCSKMQSKSCITCKWNRFGSGIGRDGKKKGKACHNTRRLVLNVQGVEMPVLISLPPTSIKALNNYLKELSHGQQPIPMFALETVFSFDSTVQYPRPVVSKGELLDFDMYRKMREYRMGEIVETALKAYASIEDYETVEEDSGAADI